MKIYDMHIHIGSGDVDHNYLIEQMEQSGVYGGGLISAAPEECDEESLFALPYKERLKNVMAWSHGYEDRFIPILRIHPDEKDICDKVADAAQEGIAAYKILCDNFAVYEPKCMKVLEAIEKTGKSIVFHSGILWSGKDSSKNNRPVHWETMMHFDSIKFSMGHCSWPWHDECIAVYGKFLNSYLTRKSSEMFFDITPGTPPIYRRDLLTKLYTVGYDVEDNIMFGTDSLSNDYNPSWVAGWLARDKEILDDLGVTDAQREKLYEKNFFRFIRGEDIEHTLPQMNK